MLNAKQREITRPSVKGRSTYEIVMITLAKTKFAFPFAVVTAATDGLTVGHFPSVVRMTLCSAALLPAIQLPFLILVLHSTKFLCSKCQYHHSMITHRCSHLVTFLKLLLPVLGSISDGLPVLRPYLSSSFPALQHCKTRSWPGRQL